MTYRLPYPRCFKKSKGEIVLKQNSKKHFISCLALVLAVIMSLSSDFVTVNAEGLDKSNSSDIMIEVVLKPFTSSRILTKLTSKPEILSEKSILSVKQESLTKDNNKKTNFIVSQIKDLNKKDIVEKELL